MLLEVQQWVDHGPDSRVIAVEESIICSVDTIPVVVAHQRGDLLAGSWTLDEPELDEAPARPAAVDPVVDLLVEKTTSPGSDSRAWYGMAVPSSP